MKKHILLLSVFLLLFISFVSADPSFYFKDSETIDLKVPCSNDGKQCDNTTLCNITINNPDGDNIVNNGVMTQTGTFFNYTVTDTNKLGEYPVTVYCFSGSDADYESFSFAITENGFFQDDLTFIIALLVVIGVCVVVALNLNDSFIWLKAILLVFAFIYSFLVPAFFVIQSTKTIFYRTFTGMLTVVALYTIIHLSKWLMEKFQVIS